ncbi:MAG: hypothetical protein AB7F31_00440 [Parachlamydiales bacterium]
MQDLRGTEAYDAYTLDELKQKADCPEVTQEWERRAKLHGYVPNQVTSGKAFFLKKVEDWGKALNNCPQGLKSWIEGQPELISHPEVYLTDDQLGPVRLWITLTQDPDTKKTEPTFFVSIEPEQGELLGEAWSQTGKKSSWPSGHAHYEDCDKEFLSWAFNKSSFGKLVQANQKAESFTPVRSKALQEKWNEELESLFGVGPHPLPVASPSEGSSSSEGQGRTTLILLGALALVALFGINQLWKRVRG